MSQNDPSPHSSELPPPRSWIDLSDAFLVRVASNSSDEKAQLDLRGLAELAPSLESQVVVQLQHPPWQTSDVVSILSRLQQRQLVIVIDDLSAFATGLASLALETGYDTFVVCHGLDAAPRSAVSRLEMIGAVVLEFEQFADECRLVSGV
ncbi:hypothetical protein [Parvularcula bermudensis]|uniref:hypothetical protein n=1 Tax=Parvularcula bermudensis TaxID=208216 RepID=UPI0003215D84|nr:hypothetical protein [Parvularcula bermudensis]